MNTQIQQQLQEIKKEKVCRLVDSSEFYPDRCNINIYTPKNIEYNKVIEAKKRTKVFKTKNRYSYIFTPSINYIKFNALQKNKKFQVVKKSILHSVEFLDSILPKLYLIQKN